MFASLRTRLVLAGILVVAVAVGTVALLASQVSASELQRFVNRDMLRNRVLIDTVLAKFDGERGLKDAQPTVARLADELGERIVVVDKDGQVVADSSGQLVGEVLPCGLVPRAVLVSVGPRRCPSSPAAEFSPLEMRRAAPAEGQSNVIFFGVGVSATEQLDLREGQPGAAVAIETGDVLSLARRQAEPVLLQSAAITVTRPQSSAADPVVAGYLSAVNRSVLFGALAAGAVAIGLTLALSRSVLRPVEALTAAARRMAQGDLSQRVDVRAPGEIGALASAFNSMADGLARQELLRRHLVTDVAHELRTPLTNIRGYLEAARDGVVTPDPAMIESLYEESLLLSRLVDDLQDLALAESGRLRLARVATPPAGLVERAAAAASPRATEKGLRLETRVAPGLPELDVDPERIGQVLRNLLNNAITHTPPGGTITLSVAADSGQEPGDGSQEVLRPSPVSRLAPHASPPRPFLTIQVSDTGPGIAPEHLPLIFERFFRGDSSRARATGGAGLGLTIVRQLVEAHGGQVWAESRPGAGATFRFTLPTHPSTGS